MPEGPESPRHEAIRVAMPGHLAFQLRKGEEGISVFDPAGVDPPLTIEEILGCFRPGSQAMVRLIADIEAKGLQVIAIEGAEVLPERLRRAHRETRPGPGMTRQQFKNTLRELE